VTPIRRSIRPGLELAGALALGLLLLAGCAAWAARSLEISLPADRILSSLHLADGLGGVLAGQLAAFGGALLLVHAALGLVACGGARLSAAAFPGLGAKGRWMCLVGWFLWLAILVFAANTTWFPASIFAGAHSWWRGRLLGLHPVEWLAAATALVTAGLALRAILRSARPRRAAGMLAGLAAIALLIGVATGSGPGKAATRATPSRPNIVIVGIDSLRSDLSLPRGGDAAMPGFREFLRGAHRFTDATTPLARTFGSWVSILTGRHPVATGARVNLMPRALVKADDTLGTALRAAGYRAVFATDESRFANIDASYGFDRVISPPIGARDMLLAQAGDMPLVNVLATTPVGGWLFPSSHANRAAYVKYRPAEFLGKLEGAVEGDEPLFLAVHLTLAHWPYSWAGFDKPGTPDAYRATYRRALEAVDAQFSSVMRILERRGILENAVVALLSDHGEALGGEHDTMLRGTGSPLEIWRSIWGHGTSVLSAPQYAVLLAMRPFGGAGFPGRPGTYGWPVSLEDLRPTLEHYATGKAPADVDGISLLPYLRDPGAGAALAPRIRFTETDFNTANTLAGNFRAAAVVDEAVDFYELDRTSGWIQFRPVRLSELLAQKQRAAIGSDALLAAVPGPPGGPPVRYLFTSRRNPSPQALASPAAPDASAEARRLWEALQRRFPGEIPALPDAPRM
jgi:hypothetical protein